MIFFWIAIALGIGAVTAFIAREKGRSPFIWAFYGAAAPVIALPHVLLARMKDEEVYKDEKVYTPNMPWLQVPHEENPTWVPSPVPPERLRREEVRSRPAAAAHTEPERLAIEPQLDMGRDDRAARHNGAELTIDPSERLMPSGDAPTLKVDPDLHPAASNDKPRRRDDGRMRAPLSSDGSEKKPVAPKKRDMRKIAALAAAAAVVGFGVPWAAMNLQGNKSSEQARAVPAPGLAPPRSTEAPATTAPDAKSEAEADTKKPESEGEEIGTAKLATPIPMKPAAPAPKQAEIVQPFQAPQMTEKGRPVDPNAPSRLDPPAPKQQQQAAKAPPPKAQPKAKAEPRPAAQEDFMAMVGRALGGSPSKATATTASAADVSDDDPAVGTSAGPMVQQVQERLRDRGFDPGSIDGRTGPKTVQAIRAYQQSVGMKPDGRIDMALMERLGIVGQQLHVFGR